MTAVEVLRLGVVGRGEIGRTEHQLRHDLGDDLERHLARLAGRNGLRSATRPCLQRATAAASPAACRRQPALELGALLRGHRGEPRLPGPRAARPPRAGPAHAVRISAGTSKGACVQPSAAFAPASSLGAERLAMGLGGAGLLWRAEADDRPAGDQRRPVGFLRAPDRAADRLRIMAVDALARQPRPRSASPGRPIGERQRPVDRDAVVVEEHDQLVAA